MKENNILSKLKEDYTLRNGLRKKGYDVPDALDAEIERYEREYISMVVMPTLKETAEKMLAPLECETYISIIKNWNGELTITDEYDHSDVICGGMFQNIPVTTEEDAIDEVKPK